MALDPMVGMTESRLKMAHDEALLALDKESNNTPDHWYPCGFAWVSVPMRKNHKMAATFKALGYTWNDYRKAYQFRMPAGFVKDRNLWQSMDYAAACLAAYSQVMRDNGITCYVETRID